MATTDHSLSKYENIISKSNLIYPGSPAVYQMTPEKEKFGTLTKLSVGQKNLNKTHKTILLVGESGTGKSTLINALVNYTMGVKFEDNIWFEIVEREERNQTESQVSDVIMYEIFGFEDQTLPYSLTIIDTPGFGDTRGVEHDLILSQRLFDLFSSEDGVHEMNAVGLVMKASDNRLSERLRYVFDSVVSLFGKDLEENIVALITHSDGTIPTNAPQTLGHTKIKTVENEKNQPVHFLFDNCQSTERTEETYLNLIKAWDLTMRGMHQFIGFVEKSTPKRQMTKEVPTFQELNSHIRITACIHNLLDRIKLIELKQKEIQQTQEALRKHEQEMKKNEKFTVEIEEVYKEKETVDGGKSWLLFFKGAVCCTVCEETCHYPGCTKAWSPKYCEVMKDSCCTSCTKKCPASDHVKEKWRYVTKTRKVQRTLQEMKNKYEKNKAGNLLENLEKEVEAFKALKNQLLEESYQHVVRMEQIALNVKSLSTYVHLDVLIEKMKEKGDSEKVQKLKEMAGQMDKETRAVLQHKISNTSGKYEDIISKSTVISSGSPAVYQMTPKKEKFGTLTRLSVGEKNMKKTNKTILLVGETGTGKSTLINALVNYTMGVKFKDNFWFEIVEREKRSQTESQTSDVIMYEIFGFEDQTLPYSLTIIDTPGFGDTRGVEHDLIISQRLFDLFSSEDGVHEINAVGLVMKASDNRLSERLRYIFDSVVSLFGKDLEKKIVVLITHSNGITPENALTALENANIKCAKNDEDEPLHFMFDNCQNTQQNRKNKTALKSAWNITKEQMDEFTDFLESCEPQKLIKTVEVLEARIRIAAAVNNLQERIELIELKQIEIQQTRDALQKYEQEMKDNEKFTVEVDEVYKEKERLPWWAIMLGLKATSCDICKETCSYPNTVGFFRVHMIFTEDKCTICTGKCNWSAHDTSFCKYVNKTRKVEKMKKELQEKYEKSKSESKSKFSLLENLQKEMESLQAEKNQLLEESYQHVLKLEEIALNVNSVSTYVHFDFLIDKMKEKGDTEKVQKMEEMRSQVDDDTKAAMQYFFDKLTSAKKRLKKTFYWS